MTAKLTAKQAEDFELFAANIDHMLLFPGARIAGYVGTEQGRIGEYWELNKTTAKKLFDLGLIERGTRRGNDYPLLLTDAGRELSAPRIPAIAVEVGTTRTVHSRGSYCAISDGRGRYQIALDGFEAGRILFAGGFWTATVGGRSERRRTVVEAFEAVVAK